MLDLEHYMIVVHTVGLGVCPPILALGPPPQLLQTKKILNYNSAVILPLPRILLQHNLKLGGKVGISKTNIT